MQPKIFHASDHDIDHTLIDPDAINLIKKLRSHGFTAYLVGGSVRDLLVKKSPKDYDISTSAKPEEIKQIFQRHCLLIGRRFRLAHVRFGHKIFEVATFRTGDNDSDLIVHDNVWGSEEEDVMRRDFTVNGLLYDPATHSIIDYVGGWDDIHKGILRTIGEAGVRFRQDPVRMLRLLKFRARFGFDIYPDARQALLECRQEIVKSSPARLLEEVFRMLESGAAAPFFSLMNEAGLLELLFPRLSEYLKTDNGKAVYLLLASNDKINKKQIKAPIDRAISVACLLYPIVLDELQKQYLSQGNSPHLGEIMMVISSVIKETVIASFTHFPRRIAATTGFILATQFRLTPLSGKRYSPNKIARFKEFELALTFLKIRAALDRSLLESYSFWYHSYRQERHGGHKHHHSGPRG